MAERAVTKAQARFHDLLAHQVGCIACWLHGWPSPEVSIHHIDGRTKKHAHWCVLPACGGHHQTGTGLPNLVAIHPYKARFEAMYGPQKRLLAMALLVLCSKGIRVPTEAVEIVAEEILDIMKPINPADIERLAKLIVNEKDIGHRRAAIARAEQVHGKEFARQLRAKVKQLWDSKKVTA